MTDIQRLIGTKKTASQAAAHLKATADLRDWLYRYKRAEIPAIPAETCPIQVEIDDLIRDGMKGLGALSDWTAEKVLNQLGGAMWRWNLCAPIEIKAALSHPGLPVRLPWPSETTDDERFLLIINECRNAGIITLTTMVRPWITAATDSDFPVEFRVFVTGTGDTSTTSYYTQRPLGDEWLPFAEQAARLGASLRPHVPDGLEFSADFLVTRDKEVLFIEGGPPVQLGADPCCLSFNHPFGDGSIVLRKIGGL